MTGFFIKRASKPETSPPRGRFCLLLLLCSLSLLSSLDTHSEPLQKRHFPISVRHHLLHFGIMGNADISPVLKNPYQPADFLGMGGNIQNMAKGGKGRFPTTGGMILPKIIPQTGYFFQKWRFLSRNHPTNGMNWLKKGSFFQKNQPDFPQTENI